MLLKSLGFIGKESITDEEYKVILLKRQKIFWLLIAAGILTIVVDLNLGNAAAYLLSDAGANHQNAFLSGLYMGTGIGLILVGICFGIRNRKALKDESFRKKKRLEAQDERNKMIVVKSLSSTCIVSMILAYVGLLVTGMVSLTIFFTLLAVTIVCMTVFLFFSLYYNKKL